ncbi:MAG: MATE family efflux transporter [Bacteroidales bacterium]|jgi:putative MATE family efflux protein|nr:MATE family efflux transporter [Bacteroidales bacterium]
MQEKGLPTELGTKNVWKLLVQYAVPSVIAMTAASVYNITDSIFIGQGVGALAISGLAVTFPFINLAAAFGAMVGVGASTLMSLRLGQKDYEVANKILGNVLLLNITLGILLSVVMLSFLDPILYFFGASYATIPYARDYMVVILLGNVITHMYFGLNALLRASGHPKISMYTTLISVLINLILTPIFIYKFDWGIRGAALATVISQILMLLWQLKIFTNTNNFIHLQRKAFRFKRKIVFDMLSIGLSPFLMNVTASAVVIIMNQSLLRYGGDNAVGAFGIINRVAFLFPMVVLGLTQGMQPIVGYNYGAGNFSRMNKALKYTIFLATGVTTIGFLIGEFMPRMVASVFTTDEELIGYSVEGLRIVLIFFPIIGFQMASSYFFQSIGMTKKAIFMSLTRQVLFLIPGLLILPSFFGLKGIWYSMPLSDLLSAIVAAFLLASQYKKTNLLIKTQNK